MKSTPTDFDPPQSSNNSSSREQKKTYIGSSINNESEQSVEEKKPKQIKPKRRRTLSVYNIFYHEVRKKILAERGYEEDPDNEKRPESPPKKRGRPRGPNYHKKRVPHHVIGFTDLTREVARRWEIHKDEYHAKYDAVVEAQKQKEKAQKKLEQKNAKAAESNDQTLERSTHSYGTEDNISEYASSSVNTQDYDIRYSNASRTSNLFSDFDRNGHEMSPNSEKIYGLKNPSDYFDENKSENQHYAVENMHHHQNFDHPHAEHSGTMHGYHRCVVYLILCFVESLF